MSTSMVPTPGTSRATSNASTNDGIPAKLTRSQRPSRQVASVRTSPAAVSSVTTVVGSVIGSVPVSRSAVTTQIVFDPLMACARSAWRTMKPASARGSVEGNTRLALAWGRPRGSSVSRRRTVSSTVLTWCSFSRAVRPGISKIEPR